MESCKDCVHYEACKMFFVATNQGITEEKIKQAENDLTDCEQFKAKSRFVELPCKVGDIVWVINKNEIYKCRVYGISIDFKSAWFTFLYNGYFPEFKEKKIYYLSEFSKTVFLTREEAEKSLKERK